MWILHPLSFLLCLKRTLRTNWLISFLTDPISPSTDLSISCPLNLHHFDSSGSVLIPPPSWSIISHLSLHPFSSVNSFWYYVNLTCACIFLIVIFFIISIKVKLVQFKIQKIQRSKLNHWYTCNKTVNTKEKKKLPWLMWLSGLSAGLRTKGSLVQFPIRAHAWVADQAPNRGSWRGNHALMFLFLSPSIPHSKNK